MHLHCLFLGFFRPSKLCGYRVIWKINAKARLVQSAIVLSGLYHLWEQKLLRENWMQSPAQSHQAVFVAFLPTSPSLLLERRKAKMEMAPKAWLAEQDGRGCCQDFRWPASCGQVTFNVVEADPLEASYWFYGPRQRLDTKPFNTMSSWKRFLPVKMVFGWFLNALLLIQLMFNFCGISKSHQIRMQSGLVAVNQKRW